LLETYQRFITVIVVPFDLIQLLSKATDLPEQQQSHTTHLNLVGKPNPMAEPSPSPPKSLTFEKGTDNPEISGSAMYAMSETYWISYSATLAHRLSSIQI